MAKTRGAHVASLSTRNPRPRASPARDSTSEAPQASTIPPSEDGKQLSGDLWLHSHLLREIWIVEPGHSTPSYVLIWRRSDNSQSLEIHFSMTTRRVRDPTVIHFTIDGRHGAPPRMLLLDLVLRSNIFPLQHMVQRKGAILEALFWISEGFYFGPHHLIITSLLHFEKKVHRKKL
ncbi:hypothetical protein AAG906_010128 [Vitis piasezkii]